MTEDLSFFCWVEPQGLAHSFDEDFLRNYAGYISDCALQGVKPAYLQVLLTAYDSGTLMTPNFWVPIWLLHAAHIVAAYGVAWLVLGYEPHYPEYNAKKNE